MTKEKWIQHIEEVSGIKRPGAENQVSVVRFNIEIADHKGRFPDCPICKERRRTRLATYRRKLKDQVMKDLGMVKVKGCVSGKVYWE